MQVLGTIGGAGVALGTLETLGLVPDVRQHTQLFSAPELADFHLQGRINATTVLVLGGGDAGLVAMYELEKAGYRCGCSRHATAPAAAPGRSGGDTNTDLHGIKQTAEFTEGQYLNAVPARIPQHHTTLAYCRELGVPIEAFVNANPEAFVLLDEAAGATGPLTGTAGVDVEYGDALGGSQHNRADYCICTIPPQVLRNIPHNLGPDVTAAVADLTPAPVGKLGLEFKRRFWEEDDGIYGGISNTSLETGPIFYPSYGYHGTHGVVIGSYSFSSGAELLGALSPEQRTDRAVEVGSRIHGPAYRNELASSFSVHWDAQEFSEGGWIEWFEDRAGVEGVPDPPRAGGAAVLRGRPPELPDRLAARRHRVGAARRDPAARTRGRRVRGHASLAG